MWICVCLSGWVWSSESSHLSSSSCPLNGWKFARCGEAGLSGEAWPDLPNECLWLRRLCKPRPSAPPTLERCLSRRAEDGGRASSSPSSCPRVACRNRDTSEPETGSDLSYLSESVRPRRRRAAPADPDPFPSGPDNAHTRSPCPAPPEHPPYHRTSPDPAAPPASDRDRLSFTTLKFTLFIQF